MDLYICSLGERGGVWGRFVLKYIFWGYGARGKRARRRSMFSFITVVGGKDNEEEIFFSRSLFWLDRDWDNGS